MPLDLAWHHVGPDFLRLVAAVILGGFIGLERSVHGQSAGLRTQMLVAAGSALAMIVSLAFGDVYGSTSSAHISVDPARVAYGVMGGIGFLGAGVILRYGTDVRGLTTAASLWCTAAIGLACGFGMYIVAIFATALILVVLWGLKILDFHLPRSQERTLIITSTSEALPSVRQVIDEGAAEVRDFSMLNHVEKDEARTTFHVRMKNEILLKELAEKVGKVPGVRQVILR